MGWGSTPLPAPLLKAYDADPSRKITEAMLARATDNSPVYSTGQGLTRLAAALISGYGTRQINRKYEDRAKDYNAKIAEVLSGGKDLDQIASGLAPVDPELATSFAAKAAESRLKANESTTAQKNFEFFQKLPPEQQQAYSALYGKKGQGFRVTSPDGSVIEYGDALPGQLTTAATTEVQKDALAGQDQLATLKTVGQKVADEHLTYEGRAKGAIGGVLDKLGMENDLTKFNASRAAALQSVEQYFNEYRKYITGAAAAQSELEALKKAVINSELGPQEFQSRYNALVEKVSADIQRNLGRAGVQTQPAEQPSAQPQTAPQSGATERPAWLPADVEVLEVIPDTPQASVQTAPPEGEQIKNLNGKNYVKRGGQWYEAGN